MTNQRRRDKESCAGCHRKRTRPRVTRSTQGKVTLERLRAEWQSSPASAQLTLGLWLFIRGTSSPQCSRSTAGDSPGPDRFFMKPRFEPDVPNDASPDLSASLI